MRLRDFDVLSFDCYGTLIDWEGGILAAWRASGGKGGSEADADGILGSFARHESRRQRETPGMPYPELLARVYFAMADELGRAAVERDAVAFGRSVPDWPAFPDSAEALARLRHSHRLVILSNVDRAGFAGSALRLGVRFDAVLTAQDIGSYKPNPANFTAMLAELAARGIGRDGILHVAQSQFHDLVPAGAAGLRTCWIDRRGDRDGWGATPPPEGAPRIDFRFPSLAALADAVHAEGG